MVIQFQDIEITELVENPPAGVAWEAWLQAHPDMASEIEIARRVRGFMQQLEQADIAVPADFEARLLERIRADKTLLDLLDLSLSGFGRALIELLNLLFGLLPSAEAASA